LPPESRELVSGKACSVKPVIPVDQFEAMVVKAKEYILAGDIIQVVLSQRFEADISSDPFDVYRALRRINPSPYLFFFRFDEVVLLGSSPEVMVRVEDDLATLRPIAGTRMRGATEKEDMALAEDLLADPKERAEHIMLVDLGRNDLGRVCCYGTVNLTELMVIERYSHVMHIVSNVEGRLRPGVNSFDVLRASFPAGTVSGAPKVRAMEIIEELESDKRGPYAGAVGYFGFSGNMDLGITIRSILIHNGKAMVQVGAGIVADSVPAKEYEETMIKGKALFKAVEMVGRGLR
jgi:anthranilate synthase component 1